MNKKEVIPKEAQEMIDAYRELELGGKKVVCPYFMNRNKSKDLRAMVGKGTPDEIILEAQIWEKLKGVSFEEMSEKEIKEFLIQQSIGIDCSGYVMHVLNHWYKSEKGRSIWSKMKTPHKSLFRRIAYWLKPVEKLGADIITNNENAREISLEEIKPGDVVRMKWKKKNSHHILLIHTVEYDKEGNVTKFRYTHSIPRFEDDSGVKYGEIAIKDITLPLEEQDWLEQDEHGVKHTLEGYLIQKEDNGLRRINAIENLLQ